MDTGKYLLDKNVTYNGMLACWHEYWSMLCVNKLIHKMQIINIVYFWITCITHNINGPLKEFFILKGQIIIVTPTCFNKAYVVMCIL